MQIGDLATQCRPAASWAQMHFQHAPTLASMRLVTAASLDQMLNQLDSSKICLSIHLRTRFSSIKLISMVFMLTAHIAVLLGMSRDENGYMANS